jgi:hypothetical protein
MKLISYLSGDRYMIQLNREELDCLYDWGMAFKKKGKTFTEEEKLLFDFLEEVLRGVVVK